MLQMREELATMTAEQAARRLLGCELVRTFADEQAVVRIVETEAYDQTDAASHSYNGMTQRTEVMFGPAGKLYVYFTYGMHYCSNIVVGPEGFSAAVLIRAVEPLSGHELLEARRGKTGVDAVNGPAKLCQALSIDKHFNRHDLEQEPIQLVERSPLSSADIVAAPRIGITKATDTLWRFYEQGNPYISRR